MVADRIRKHLVGPKGYYKWISLSEISDLPNMASLQYYPNGVYVAIGEYGAARVTLGVSKSVVRFDVYYDTEISIPDEWFYKEWLYFLEGLRDIGYKKGDCIKDKFSNPKNKKIFLFKFSSISTFCINNY